MQRKVNFYDFSEDYASGNNPLFAIFQAYLKDLEVITIILSNVFKEIALNWT
jgi:hypothetical protein